VTTATEEVLRRAYSAYNQRDVESALELMSEDVTWPDVGDGGFVHGHDEVREHWRQQFSEVDPRIEPLGLRALDDGRVGVDVRQVVRSPDGELISDDRLLHAYTLREGLIERMEIVADAGPG
jgi:hypothetical protein